MPFVTIEDIFVNNQSDRQDFGPNEIQITIVYNILPLDTRSTLTISNSTV